MTQTAIPGTAPVDIDSLLANPSAYFDHPGDILNSSLSRAAQRKLLHQWDQDARLLAEAETEGMSGGEESMLSRVRRAILAFEERETDRARPRAPRPSGPSRIPLAAAAMTFAVAFLLARRDSVGSPSRAR
jgi:hypothetical protein